MKHVLIIFLLLSNFVFSQVPTNQELESESKRLNIELLKTQKQLILLDKKIEDVTASLSAQSKSISAIVDKNDKALRIEVTSIYDSLQKNSLRVTANDSKINMEQAKSEKNFLYSIIGILVLLFLLVGIYILNQKRAKSLEVKTGSLDASTQKLKDQLAELSTITSEDLANALAKFASIFNSQHEKNNAPDHSMVIEFAKQIVSMENNISRMDANDAGMKRIKRAIENMHNTLKSMEYEITPLLGREVIVGQIIEIDRQEAKEDIELGKKIVFNVVKAELLFKGIQIQRGKVDVYYNPND